MTDYYKILNLTFGASETEIRKQFRKLAIIHHPDKNGSSIKSEETFKAILTAYETLSNVELRPIYDMQYVIYFKLSKSIKTDQDSAYANKKQGQNKQKETETEIYQQTTKTNTKINYTFWAILGILIITFLYGVNKLMPNGIPKTEQALEEATSERPHTGELNFNK